MPVGASAEVTQAPTPSGDYTCTRGVLNGTGSVCCSKTACGGKCGGAACDTLPGGYYNCCAPGINSLGRSCLTNESPCTMSSAVAPSPPDPTCSKGTLSALKYVAYAAAVLSAVAPSPPDPTCSKGTLNALRDERPPLRHDRHAEAHQGTDDAQADGSGGGDTQANERADCRAEANKCADHCAYDGGADDACADGLCGRPRLSTAAGRIALITADNACADGRRGRPHMRGVPNAASAAPVTNKVCCPKTACGGTCGGDGCKAQPGGYDQCCALGIIAAGAACASAEAPCIITPSATKAPTAAATPKPTHAPTVAPTAKPTAAPTPAPGDYSCDRGVLNANGTICCPRDLCSGQCGGTACSTLPGGFDACCINGIIATNRSCVTNDAPCVITATPKPTTVKPTLAPTRFPPPPDPTCAAGIPNTPPRQSRALEQAATRFRFPPAQNHVVCCPADACGGTCGGLTCASQLGGYSACCSAGIQELGVSCADQGAPCKIPPTPKPTAAPTAIVIADPGCAMGIPSNDGTACCPAALCNGKCGGTGCADLPGGQSNCCVNAVKNTGRKCSTTSAPCEIVPYVFTPGKCA
ncbi:hypothetical protein JKP88DRAFT_246457 [Tribonema minus]|uniref:Uncharacterized protein n=1 Tax=Tribonema minus TaxID=303371 RepID=A0A836CC61_9STRA|nr:hypothetical protein JKP88DRAFT_246457 [Tribonema minus]